MSEYVGEFKDDRIVLVEVVRCRDCIYAVGDAMYCTEGCCDESEYRNVEPDGFCAWGERK